MTDDGDREIHRVHMRINSLISFLKWAVGLFLPALIGLLVMGFEMHGRVSSLETSRDSTIETLQRIDRNLEALTRNLMGDPR
jgi:hypothetical protein